MWKLSISEISTLLDYRGQLRHFLNGFLIFLTIPNMSFYKKTPFLEIIETPAVSESVSDTGS